MRLIFPTAKIMSQSMSYGNALSIVAEAAAQCYNKTLPDTLGAMEDYVRARRSAGHESVLEHASISVKFTVDRGLTHELVRHRICAITQESTRYCNYGSGKYEGHVTFIIPPWFSSVIEAGVYDQCTMQTFPGEGGPWMVALLQTEKAYLDALKDGFEPEKARSLLPNATKADIIITANMREWRHIFRLRALGTTGRPHPQMLEVMFPLLQEFEETYPVFFEDLTAS